MTLKIYLNMYIIKTLKKIKINKKVYHNKFTYKVIASTINHDNLLKVNHARDYISDYSPKPSGISYTENKLNGPDYDLKIIIPAYNVEQYIEECLMSILSQKTEYTFSVVVINDGSSDNTAEVIKKYEHNSNINVINQSHKGVSEARNAGLREINSKYLMFVDADDKLADNAIQALLTSAFENNSDIVEGSHYSFGSKYFSVNKTIHKNNKNVKALGNLRGYPWGKVIRSSLFQNIKYPQGYWHQDTIFPYLVFPRCKKSSTISEVVYWYRHNPNGISMRSLKNKKCIDTYWILEQMLEDMEKHDVVKTQDIYEQTLRQIHLNFARTQLMNDEIHKSIFSLSVNIIQKQFNGFQSQDNKYEILEQALRNNDYVKYVMFCTLL